MKTLANKYYGLMALLALSPIGAFAAGSGKNAWDKVVGLQDEGGNALGLIFNLALVTGVGLVFLGLWKVYEKYGTNQSQVKGSTIIAALVAGGALMSLKYFSGDWASIFESDSEGPKKQTVNW